MSEDLRDYGASVPFSEVEIVNEVSEVSAYWYLRDKLHFGRTDDKPEGAGISFRQIGLVESPGPILRRPRLQTRAQGFTAFW